MTTYTDCAANLAHIRTRQPPTSRVRADRARPSLRRRTAAYASRPHSARNEHTVCMSLHRRSHTADRPSLEHTSDFGNEMRSGQPVTVSSRRWHGRLRVDSAWGNRAHATAVSPHPRRTKMEHRAPALALVGVPSKPHPMSAASVSTTLRAACAPSRHPRRDRSRPPGAFPSSVQGA